MVRAAKFCWLMILVGSFFILLPPILLFFFNYKFSFSKDIGNIIVDSMFIPLISIVSLISIRSVFFQSVKLKNSILEINPCFGSRVRFYEKDILSIKVKSSFSNGFSAAFIRIEWLKHENEIGKTFLLLCNDHDASVFSCGKISNLNKVQSRNWYDFHIITLAWSLISILTFIICIGIF